MLTRAQIEEARPRSSIYELYDSEGLVLRVLPSGTRSWAVYYHERGRKRRETVGRWPDMGLREARRQRDQVRARAAGADAVTVEAFAREYLSAWARPAKRSWREDARILEREIVPAIGDRPVATLTRRDCVAAVDAVRERGAPAMASKTHAVLRRLLQVAVERGVRDDNPAARIRLPAAQSRDRVLTMDEVAALRAELATSTALPRIALELILATGQRGGEVLEMAASDLQLGDGLWEIPAAKAKNGHAHVVPLTAWAVELIREARRIRCSERVIPISGDTLRHAMRQAVEAANLERSTPHDLRRTVATHLGRLGHGRAVQDRILNHVDQSVGGIYDRYDYLPEQRAALEAWEAEVTGAGNRDHQGEGVVPQGVTAAPERHHEAPADPQSGAACMTEAAVIGDEDE
ncbi:Site-specific recombinase XerD [Thiohalospira halophila DSM 15071]|uniref:Site-specific recombinase XerD n=1 Tax=Thiohalospira halophila DSM 15071 TaxID=1123397 RepID=A0A1I1U9Q9_9GAMM|nr:site-specific integrase [Thiohalospira halophila]SFD67586.1 Site-specific recombinase XerD [Thiohalospira halophila DSM 15071]